MLGGTRSNLRLKEAVDRGPVHARLVVLEPQTLTRKALCSLLRGLRTGTLVGDAGDWEEAIRVLRAAKANILVATLDASGAFSPGVVRDIRAACKDVKILVLASNQEPELANAMHRAGADGYL
ncbi:MAG: response regulator transcription factor, partial [Deltaproteobacteria bacterium]|nr:response regulator transcription factor [Deltaproteobacteria bacterium]